MTILEHPLDYASIHHKLGDAYTDLAKLADEASNLKKAQSTYIEALKVYTFEDTPLDHKVVFLKLEKIRRIVS
ncbi:MAG TPA: hypothetical protein DHW81_05455 [Nitrospiraceae bacterium]|nr:hypothetical protein [Nitrospiraceae bacterium]